MRKSSGLLLRTLVAGLLCGMAGTLPATETAATKTPATAQRQLSPAQRQGWYGLWVGPRSLNWNLQEEEGAPEPTPPLQGEYLADFQKEAKRLTDQRAGKTVPERIRGCVVSMPSFMLSNFFPYEFVPTDHGLYIIAEFHRGVARKIYTDGRGHPSEEDAFPRYMGHSIGHWEGDTLVVDTVQLAAGPVDSQWRHSDKLRINETFRMVGQDQIESVITLTDPEALTKPVTSTRIYRRSEEKEMLEAPCILGEKKATWSTGD